MSGEGCCGWPHMHRMVQLRTHALAFCAWLSLCASCETDLFQCRGLHFLAIQSDEEAEESSGLWLLQEYMGPPA
jgi:RNA-binding protein Tab2/Atab2